MKTKRFQRLLSLVLALALCAGLLPGMFARAADLDETEYATPATETELNDVPKWFTGNDGSGKSAAYAKLVDGTVYVWGQNGSFVLGITEYIDANDALQPVVNNTVVPLPTAIPAKYFNNEKVTKIKMSYGCGLALTEANNIYAWGSFMASYVPLNNGGATPTKLDTTAVEGNITQLSHSGAMLYIQDDLDNWYSAGAGGHLQMGQTVNTKVFTKVPDALYAALGTKADGTRRNIVTVVGEYSSNTFILTDDGLIFGFGTNDGSVGAHQIGTGVAGSYITTPAKVSETEALSGKTITCLTGEDQGTAVVDNNGDVWAWGASNSNRFGTENSLQGDNRRYYPTPTKVFDHVVMGKKAVRVWLSFNRTMVLCADNTLYAMGSNNNGMILQGGGNTVTSMTQVAKNISEKHTIVGVAANNYSMMILTKAGDMIFTGDNTSGAAGTGSAEQVPPGDVVEVIPPTLPPAEPLTKNEISFEIELADKTTYLPSPISGKAGRMLKTNADGTTEYIDNLVIAAGSSFKVNVYFEDFGKLHTFTMPIRFDPATVQAVNAAGEQYDAAASTPTTPGKLAGSGIEQCFTDLTWKGGRLAGTDGVSGTYPKICNKDGWVSVFGYTTDHSAKIDGRQKMFSVSFTAVKTTSGTCIEFADSENATKYITSPDPGYDVTSNGLEGNNYGPYWTIHNQATTDLVSAFDFNHGDFPTFQTKVQPLNSIQLRLYYGSGSEMTEVADFTDGEFTPAKAVNWSNKDVVYTLKVLPNPTDASFPQVNWTYQLKKPDNGTSKLEDYISIVEEKDTYIKFKISDSADFAESDPLGKILFEAKAKQYSNISSNLYVIAKSFEAPGQIRIAEKWNGDAVANEEFIYHYTSSDDENTQFTVDYGEETPQNPAVLWKLLDADGNELDTSDPTCKVTFGGIDGAAHTASVVPHYTTPGDTYVILHVESLFDSAKYDEVKLKVHMYATEMKFKQDVVRMAINAEKDLSQFLQIAPLDVYETDLSWEISDVPAHAPGNLPEGADPDASYTYASLGGLNGALLSSYEYATPKVDASAGILTEEYVTVTVTDGLSGQSTSVNVSIMDLNSPVKIDDMEARNLLGADKDVLMIKQGLEEGDKLELYASYDAAEPFMAIDSLVAAQTPNYNFSVPGLLDGGGGELAVRLTRTVDGEAIEFDRVPVQYTAEPSLVQGYVRLLGKDDYSPYNEGIRIDLTGVNHQETVYTGENGYFKFKEYIAPGNYTLTISKPNYLTRWLEADKSTGYQGLTIPVAEAFNISTFDSPIYLYPGEMTGDNAINIQDITYYVANWVGQYNPDIPNFDAYDFKDSGEPVINALDLELILMRKDWVRKSYPQWSTPVQ